MANVNVGDTGIIGCYSLHLYCSFCVLMRKLTESMQGILEMSLGVVAALRPSGMDGDCFEMEGPSVQRATRR